MMRFRMQGLTQEQVLLLEAEVLRAAAVQSYRNTVEGRLPWMPGAQDLLTQRFSAPPQAAAAGFRPEGQQQRR
jgi:hypothetical protein